MGKLYVNELFKIWKQKSFRITAFIIAGLIVIIPSLSFLFNLVIRISSYSDYEDEKRNRKYAEECHENEDYAGAEYYSACAEIAKFFSDNNIKPYSWKYERTFYNYSEKFMQKRVYDLLAEGKYTEEEMERFYWDMNKYVYDFNYNFIQTCQQKLDPELVNEYYVWYNSKYFYDESQPEISESSKFESNIVSYEEARDIMSEILAEYEKEVLEMTSRSLIEESIASSKQDYKDYQTELQEAKKELAEIEKMPEGNDKIAALANAKEKIAIDETYIAHYPKFIECQTYLLDNDLEIDSWQSCTVGLLSEIIYSLSMTITPDKDYCINVLDVSESDYKEQERSDRIQREAYEEAFDELVLSVKTGNAVAGVLDNSGKSQWKTMLNTSIFLITIFSIVIAGTSIANEHSSGTIRLLLARPCTRSKILLSKMLSALSISAAMMLFAFVTSYIEILIFTGGSDMLMADIITVFGKAITVSPIITTFLRFMVLMIVPFTVMMMTFFISALTKKAPLSLIVSFIVYSQLSTVSTIAIVGGMLTKYLRFLSLTIFPYLDMNVFTMSAGEYVVSTTAEFTILDIIGAVSGQFYVSARALYPVLGAIMILLVAALFIFFTFLSFNRKEIKD